MLASELLGSKWLDEHEDIDITGIAYDSRNVLPGNIFVCIKGFETDGHKYAEMAVKNGASLIVAEDKIDVDVPVWYVENSRVEIAEMACKYYGNPSSKFKLIGITGTNGKTTITYLIKSIIETAGMRIGVIGTNQNIIGDKVLVTQSTTPTTPNALELQQLFAEMVDSDAECVVMEVSSHALELERVHGCHFDVGVFTNLTRDHLDFHKTMENYLNAKAKLFKISDKGVVNFDDDGGKKIVANNDCDILKVGLSDGCDLKAKNIEISSSGADFDVEYDGKTYRVHIVIPGKFSVYNAICAMGAALQMGIDMDTIIQQVALGHATKGTPNFIREDLEEAEKGLSYEYNVEKANQILDELGYHQKNSEGIRLDASGSPLHFSLLTYSDSTNRVRAAELISKQLKDIGIDVEVTSMESTAVDDKVWPEFDVSKGRDFDMTMWGWSAPVMLNGGSLAALCSSDYAIGNDNIGGYKNDEFDKLVSNYQSATTIEEANEASKEMQKFIANEYPFITLYYDDNLYACNTSMYDGWVASKSGSTLNVFSFLPEEVQK